MTINLKSCNKKILNYYKYHWQHYVNFNKFLKKIKFLQNCLILKFKNWKIKLTNKKTKMIN